MVDHRKSKGIKKKKFASLTTRKPLTMWITVEQWNILNEMGILDHMVCLLRNLYAGQEQQLELDMEQCTGSKLGKLSSSHRIGKVSFHSNPKERQCQRMFKLLHNFTHHTC